MTATSYQQVSRYLLQAVFQLYPPPCPTYLLTDEHPTVDDSNPDMQIFRPADTLNLARLGENLQQEVAAQSDSAGHVHLPAEQSALAAGICFPRGPYSLKLSPSFTCGCFSYYQDLSLYLCTCHL